MLISACSTAVSGHGVRVGGLSIGPSGGAPRTGLPSTGLPGTGFPSSTAPSSSCAASSISPAGAPFCYPLPSQFHDASSTAQIPGTDEFKTAVEPNAIFTSRDLVTVSSAHLISDSDDLSSESLSAGFDAVTALSATIAARTPTQARELIGHRAFESVVTYRDGVHQRYIQVFAGYVRLDITCQWQRYQARIATGCSAVSETLQLQR